MQSEHPGADDGALQPTVLPSLPPAVPPPPVLPPPIPGPVRHGFVFTGRAGEYFGIWFVNIVLTVLTLGIYSAWAKVRTERYFYGNTRVGGTPFEYLAKPLPILIGRLIAYTLAAGLALSWHYQLFALWGGLFALTVLALPFVVQRAMRFRARYSAWRGLRFRFVDGVYEAYVAFLVKPLAWIPSFGLLAPWVRLGQHDYIVRGHRFGGLRFNFTGDLGRYYIPFLISMGIAFGAYVLMFAGIIVVSVIGAMLGGDGKSGAEPATSALVAIFVPVVLGYLALLAIPVFLRTRYTNLMWEYSSLGPHRFESTLRSRDMIWLFFSNSVAILLTLGLAYPWTACRVARYRAAHFAIWAYGGLDGFGAEGGGKEGATGAELVEALEMPWVDIGL